METEKISRRYGNEIIQTEGNAMVFVVAGSSRERLADLTKMLLSNFPGSTIYQHVDPWCISKDVVNNKVNGVFLEAEIGSCNGIELMWQLRNRKRDVPFYILSVSEDFRITAIKAGADGYLVYPLTGETVRGVLMTGQQ